MQRLLTLRPALAEAALIAAAAALLAWWLLVPPAIGVADNGDYSRVMAGAGLAPAATGEGQPFFVYANRTYRFVPPRVPRWYLSSAELPVQLLLSLRAFGVERESFDLRFLAALYSIVHLGGLWLLLAALRPLESALRWPVAALLVVILTDAGYVAYFNSFYGEAVAVALLPVAIGSAALLWRRARWRLALVLVYFSACALITTAKPQYLSLAPFMALLGVVVVVGSRDRGAALARRALPALAGGLAAALLALAYWSYRTSWPALRQMVPYVAIFMDLVPNSPDPRQDLIDLGLDPDWVRLSGTAPFHPDSAWRTQPQFREEFMARVDHGSMARFYLAHPARFGDLLRRSAGRLFVTRLPYLGYYGADSGRPGLSRPRSPWSVARERWVPRTVWFLGLYVGCAAVASVLTWRAASAATRGAALLCLFLLLTGVSQYLTSILAGGGVPDLSKHLLLFNLAFDGCIALAVLGALSASRRWLSSRRAAPARTG